MTDGLIFITSLAKACQCERAADQETTSARMMARWTAPQTQEIAGICVRVRKNGPSSNEAHVTVMPIIVSTVG
jgi:hypothetical protein